MHKRSYWKAALFLIIVAVSLYHSGILPVFLSKSVRSCSEFVKTKLAVAPVQRPAQTGTAVPSQRQSFVAGAMASGSGEVIRLLPDDNKGSRHQRFIIKLSSGQTLLIAHNIDIAPRVENINLGDTVSFFGQYEPNEKGGVIHWTHRDPKGQHTAGWLNHKSRMYQ